MKRSKRRVLAFLLCVFMLLGTGMSAMAGETGTTGPDVENNHTVTPGSTDEPDSNQPADSQTGIETGNEEEKEISEKNETQDAATGDDTSEKQISVDHQFTYEDENISAVIHVAGNVSVVKQTEMSDEISAQELEMKAVPQSEEQPEYEAAKAYAEENSADEAEIDVTVLDLEFTCGGQPVDVSACEITAEITPSEKLQEEAETLEVSDEIADEAEIGIQLMALTANDAGETEEAGSVTVEKGAEDVPRMAVALNAAEPKLQIVTREANNPKFTVQYYANLEVTNRSDDGRLKILNTDNGGTNQGGKLPTNGGNTPTTGLYLVDAGNGKQKIQTHMELTELYTANEYEYFSAPSLPYVNIFRNGKHN